MSNLFALSAACKDAFIVLKGAKRIEYIDGDVWELEDKEGGLDEKKQKEHPAVKALRACSLLSIEDPPSDDFSSADEGLQQMLKSERIANNNLREFLVKLEDVLHENGMPRDVIGEEVLTWLKGRLSAKRDT